MMRTLRQLLAGLRENESVEFMHRGDDTMSALVWVRSAEYEYCMRVPFFVDDIGDEFLALLESVLQEVRRASQDGVLDA